MLIPAMFGVLLCLLVVLLVRSCVLNGSNLDLDVIDVLSTLFLLVAIVCFLYVVYRIEDFLNRRR